MDFKKIGMITGGAVGSFIVIVAITYFLFPYINPEVKEEVQAEKPKMEKLNFNPGKLSPVADSLNNPVQNLQEVIDSLKMLETGYVSQIDSLKEHVAQVQQEKANLLAKMEEANTKSLENVSRSLLNLDEDALAPIVNLLSDSQLIGLYKSANNMQRAKLLQTLKPDKAATILKKVM